MRVNNAAARTNDEIAVEANGLTKNYNSKSVVNAIDFTVFSGETFALLGPNGAGKSTTMRMIACRAPVSNGELRVGGFDVRTDGERVRGLIGVVPQENNLDPDLNVRENLLVYSNYFRLSRADAEIRVKELLEFVKLADRAGSRVDELSGGMRRRLMIARALIHRPRILLLDEPTTGLDPNVRQDIWEKIEELRRTENLTVLLSTHYMDEAEKLCHRLIILSNGNIVASGVPAELVRERVNRYAFEVRETQDLPLPKVANDILMATRGTTLVFFAESPEMLAPLMNYYQSRPVLLRPSNLEDVFLEITVGETV